jgi:transcriptional regulator with XRE-family HTH domain
MKKQTYSEWLRATLFKKRISQSKLSKALGYAEGVINQKLRRNSFTWAEKYFIDSFLEYPYLTESKLVKILDQFKN